MGKGKMMGTDFTALLQAGEYAEAVERLVKQRDCVSMIEVENLLEPYLPIRGYVAWVLDDPNLILWLGMSEEFMAVLKELNTRKRVFPHPASLLIYMIDGGRIPTLPIAKKPPKGGYKTEHWIPICLRPVPIEEPKGRRQKKAGTAADPT
jgi:hypothetical protein